MKKKIGVLLILVILITPFSIALEPGTLKINNIVIPYSIHPSEFGSTLQSGNPKQKINFLFLADEFKENEKDLFLRIINEISFGNPNPDSLAFFKNNVYKDEKDKFNFYYFIKYNEDYGYKDFIDYNKIYDDLLSLRESAEITEEIDYFIFITKSADRPDAGPFNSPEISGYNDDVIKKTNRIYLPIDITNIYKITSEVPTLFH